MLLKRLIHGVAKRIPVLIFVFHFFSVQSQSGIFQLADDISPLTADAEIGELFEFNGNLYFKANDGTNDTELWEYDGTNAAMIGNIDVTSGVGSNPNSFIEYNDSLYFQADDHNTNGNELWKFNGVSVSLAADINTGATSSNPSDFTVFNGDLYFSADGGSGREIWVYDGATASSLGLPLSNPTGLIVYNGNLCFSADDGINGRELWEYDGVVTISLVSIRAGGASSDPQGFTIFNSNLYFSADDGTNGRELWKYNGSTASLASDINSGGGSSNPEYFTSFNNALYFAADDGGGDVELFLFDGTTLSKADPVSTILNPKHLTVFKNKLFFSADDVTNGEELAVFNGSSIQFAGNLYAGASSASPLQKLVYNGKLFFAANDGISGVNELWTYSEGITISWTGNTSMDWFTNTNWNPAQVPVYLDSVVIPNVSGTTNLFPQIAGPGAVANDIYIAAGASLIVTLVNNSVLQVYGDIINNGSSNLGQGEILFKGYTVHNLTGNIAFDGIVRIDTGSTLVTNGNLTIESGGSLLHGIGTPGAQGSISSHNVVVKRTGYSSSALWNYWCSPVLGANVNIIGNNRYHYDPDAATSLGSLQGLQAGWKSTSGVMAAGKGYIAQGGGTVSFSGTLNNLNNGDSIFLAITKNASTGVGYNLIGNPYPSALNADKFMQANGPSGAPFNGNNTVNGAMYFWDEPGTGSGYSTADFATWSGAGGIAGPNNISKTPAGHIATGQGFFIEKIINGTSNIFFDNTMRSTQNNLFFRQAPIERLWVSVTNSYNLYNEILIAFINDATDGLDRGYDAKKMRGNQYMALYSKLNNADYAIQALSEITNDKIVELGLDAGLTGSHMLNLKKVEYLDETVVIMLEDKYAGTFQHLRLNPQYYFTISSTGAQHERFYLHFNPPMQMDVRDESCAGNDGGIIIVQQGSIKWDYTLADQSGNVVASKNGFNGQNTITNLSPGTYTLSLTDRDGYNVVKYINVKRNYPVAAGFSTSDIFVPVGTSVNLTNSSIGATTYEWNFGDGSPLSGVENPIYAYSNEGTYTVELHAFNASCSDYYNMLITVTNLATTQREISYNSISIFSDHKMLYVDISGNINPGTEIFIYDVLGRELFRKTISQQKTTFDLNAIPGDFFLVKINANGDAIVRQILDF